MTLAGFVASQAVSFGAKAESYYPYGGGLVAGFVLGFSVYDELIPISWAIVTATIESYVIGQTSSLGGGYFELLLPVGFYNLTVEEYGFISKTMQIFVSSGSSTTLQFILEQGQRTYTYPVTISVAGFASDYYSSLKVDGKYEGVILGSNSRTLVFRLGSVHLIEVDSYVNGSDGVRYFSESTNRTVNDVDSIVFSYRPQYHLRTEERVMSISSVEGWYEAGARVESPSATEQVDDVTGVRHVFKNWVVDGVGVVGNPISIIMNKPHTLSVSYQTQYYVDVRSDYGNPTGSGWYDADSSVAISVTTPQGFGVEKVFDHWEGDQSSKSSTTSILVDSPKTLTAKWRDDHIQLYLAIAAIASMLVIIMLLARSRKRTETKSKQSL